MSESTRRARKNACLERDDRTPLYAFRSPPLTLTRERRRGHRIPAAPETAVPKTPRGNRAALVRERLRRATACRQLTRALGDHGHAARRHHGDARTSTSGSRRAGASASRSPRASWPTRSSPALHRRLPALVPATSRILENNAMQSAASAAGVDDQRRAGERDPRADDARPRAMIPTNHWRARAVGDPDLVDGRVPRRARQAPDDQHRAAALSRPASPRRPPLKALHEHGGEAAKQARALFISGFIGALITWMRDAEASWIKVTEIPWLPKWALFHRLELGSPALLVAQVPEDRGDVGTSWLRIGTFKDAPLMLNQVTMSLRGLAAVRRLGRDPSASGSRGACCSGPSSTTALPRADDARAPA